MDKNLKRRITDTNTSELTRDEINALADYISEETGRNIVFKGISEYAIILQDDNYPEYTIAIDLKETAIENETIVCFGFGCDVESDCDFVDEVEEILEFLDLEMVV